jgi:DNA-binding FadR family transcriptional regulator
LSTRIAELIGRGEFDDAGRLPSEVVLANRFGVSRPVVREALSHLRSMGFIVSRKGSGSYIKKPAETAPHHLGAVGFGPVNSLAEVRKCYEFRIGLEGEAAYYAAQNRTPETLAAMREALKRMEAAISRGLVGMSEAIEAQDKDAARLAMRAHIEDACMRIFEGPGGGSSRTAEPRT